MWTLDYLEDIESDLSAFHRVDDYMTMSGPRFFSLALRLAAYTGVLQARAIAEREEAEGGHQSPAQASTSSIASATPGGRPNRVSNDVAFAQLSDGWLEYHTEEKS